MKFRTLDLVCGSGAPDIWRVKDRELRASVLECQRAAFPLVCAIGDVADDFVNSDRVVVSPNCLAIVAARIPGPRRPACRAMRQLSIVVVFSNRFNDVNEGGVDSRVRCALGGE